MGKKREVKGTTQIDWAISLAVFLFYLAWFFLYVNPTILHTSSAEELVDPTGCGDAYRAGLLYGISRNMDWQQSGQLASLMGSIKIACRGGQNHQISRGQIEARYRAAFGTNF